MNGWDEGGPAGQARQAGNKTLISTIQLACGLFAMNRVAAIA
jgi:hypothetical protein